METFKITTPGSWLVKLSAMRALLAFLLLQQLAAIFTQASLNLPDGIENILGFKPTSSFRCERDGYFGDIDNDCRIFHLCQKQVHAHGRVEWRHWTYACGNQTMFNQLTLTCAFVDEAIPCRHASQFQYLNEVIHKSREPFLTDADVTSGISYYSNRIMSDGARARAFEDAQLMAQLVQPHVKPPNSQQHTTTTTIEPLAGQPEEGQVEQVLKNIEKTLSTTTAATTTFQPVLPADPIRFVKAPDLNTINFAISTDHKLNPSTSSLPQKPTAHLSEPLTTTTPRQPVESIAPQRQFQAFQEPRATVLLVPVRRKQQQFVQRTNSPVTLASTSTDGQRTTPTTNQPLSQEISGQSRRVRGNNGQSLNLARRQVDKQPALVMRRTQNHQQQHHNRQVRAHMEERNFAEQAFWRAPFDIQIPNPRFESLMTRRRV